MNGITSAQQRQAVKVTLVHQYEEAIDELLSQVEMSEGNAIEEVVHAWNQEEGRRTLQTIAGAVSPHYASPSLPCGCGQRGQYQRQRVAQVLTCLGSVRHQRAYYVCAGCHQGWCLLDRELGWCAGSVSRQVQSQIAVLAAHVPFAQVAEVLHRLRGLSLSPTTCQRVADEVGHWMQSHASDGADTPLGATVNVSMDDA